MTILEAMRKDEDRFSALIVGVIQERSPFLKRTGARGRRTMMDVGEFPRRTVRASCRHGRGRAIPGSDGTRGPGQESPSVSLDLVAWRSSLRAQRGHGMTGLDTPKA